jgi:HSP20 family protein
MANRRLATTMTIRVNSHLDPAQQAIWRARASSLQCGPRIMAAWSRAEHRKVRLAGSIRKEKQSMLSRFNDPFATILALQRALEARLESDWMGAGTTGIGGNPPINIFQRGDDFVAVIELPGIDKNELQIEAKENTIRVFGRKTATYQEGASMHRRERISGVFDRTMSLPVQINPGAVRAEYRNGILALSVPRAESEKPRTIKINRGAFRETQK